MIRWIQSRRWLPNVALSAIFLIVFSLVDLNLGSPKSLAVTVTIAASIFFAVRLKFLSLALLALVPMEAIVLQTGITPGFIGLLVALYLLATGKGLRARFVALALCVLVPLVVFYSNVPKSFQANSQLVQFLISALLVVCPLSVFWGSRLAITRVVHVETSLDQRVVMRESATLALRVAEQNERFQIAREISEVILQEITAVLSQAEGGSYAAKADPSAAVRVLDKVAINARAAHQDLRRLYDQLNRNLGIQAAPPRIDDLDNQIVLLREFGYTASIKHSGNRFAISEGAELAIYRLVFDALENVKDHVPAGASVSIDFSWVGEGLQVLVKDNGIEVANRTATAIAEASGVTVDTSYSISADLDALVKPIVGASITAMRERAALYGGAVEVTKVPGVGFTVSAIFPQLRNLAGEN